MTERSREVRKHVRPALREPATEEVTEFREQDLTGARFERTSLRDATFTRVVFNDARVRGVDFSGAQVRGSLFHGSRMRGAERDLTALEKEN